MRTVYRWLGAAALVFGVAAGIKEYRDSRPRQDPVEQEQTILEKPIYEQSAQENQPVQEVPVPLPTRKRDPLESAPLNVKLGVASRRLYNAVRSTRLWKEGGIEVQRLELDEVGKYIKRVKDYNAGNLSDIEGRELLVEMQAYMQSTVMLDLEERQREAK